VTQQAATHRPRSQERKSPATAPIHVLQPAQTLTPGWATSLIRVIRGQASSGNHIREAQQNASLRT